MYVSSSCQNAQLWRCCAMPAAECVHLYRFAFPTLKNANQPTRLKRWLGEKPRQTSKTRFAFQHAAAGARIFNKRARGYLDRLMRRAIKEGPSTDRISRNNIMANQVLWFPWLTAITQITRSGAKPNCRRGKAFGDIVGIRRRTGMYCEIDARFRKVDALLIDDQLYRHSSTAVEMRRRHWRNDTLHESRRTGHAEEALRLRSEAIDRRAGLFHLLDNPLGMRPQHRACIG